MATISENIQRINKAKTDIKNAIIAKGGSVADDDKIDTYATAISALPSGGGGAELPQNLSRLVTDEWGRPTKITIKGSVGTISDNAFKNGQLEDVIIGNGITTIGESAFRDCYSLTSVTIPDSVTSIGGGAFVSCSFTGITIPDNVTSIGDEAFYHCQSLTGISIPNSVTKINDDVFKECSNLTTVTIPNGVTSIGMLAFKGCYKLTSVLIGKGVTSIGMFAFYDCRSLKTFTIKASTPPTLDGTALDDSVTAIYVPSDSVDTYKSASGWSKYADKIQAIQE